MAQRTSAKLLAATVTALLPVGDGLALLPVLLEVLPLDDDDVEDDVKAEEEDDLVDVARSVALLKVEFEFVVELVPDVVEFPKLPVLVVEFVPELVIVELLEELVVPVELVELDPDETMGVPATLVELEEAAEEGEEVLAVPVEACEAEVDARATMALVGQVEHPPVSGIRPE